MFYALALYFLSVIDSSDVRISYRTSGLLLNSYNPLQKGNCTDIEKMTLVKPSDKFTGEYTSFYTEIDEESYNLCSLVDFDAAKAFFKKKEKNILSDIVKISYSKYDTVNNKIYNDEYYANFISEDKNNVFLKANSSEVLKHLIGIMIYNCMKASTGILLNLRRKILNFSTSEDFEKKFTFSGFCSFEKLIKWVNHLFLIKSDFIFTPQEGFYRFVDFYIHESGECRRTIFADSLVREECLKLYNFSKNLYCFCEYLLNDKFVSNELVNCEYENNITLSKCLYIEFIGLEGLKNESSFKFFNKRKQLVHQQEATVFFGNVLLITFDFIKNHNIKFIKIKHKNDLNIELDISKYIKTGKIKVLN